MEPIILPRISDQKPLVSVVSITYNHEPYIRDCLEGFLMQKTNFPVEVIIHDDASTDHTADIIREYYEKRPDFFHVIIERENQFSKGKSLSYLYNMAKGKYIALCEGDDYWTNPLKLQKQYDFMEANSDYSCCIHNYYVCHTNKKAFPKKNIYISKKDILLEDCLKNGTTDIKMCTVFFNKNVIDDFKTLRNGSPVGDYPLQLACVLNGKIYNMHETMSACRFRTQGSWSDRTSNKEFLNKHITGQISWLEQIRGILNNDDLVDIAIGKYWLWYSQNNEIMLKQNTCLQKYLKEKDALFRIKYAIWEITLPMHEIWKSIKRMIKKMLGRTP